MGLRIWLPLNGDLHNQGLDDITVINNGATINNNGKIGKCYSFDGSQYMSVLLPNLANYSTTECSMCVWVKFPNYSSGNKQILNIGTSSGWTNIRFGILYRTGYPQVMTSISNNSSSVNYNCSAVITENDWNHVAVVFSERALKLYINGVLAKTYSTTYDISFDGITSLGIGAAPNGAETFTGSINDVRIYDHALSPREVKEISKGLVCHYTLSNGGGENLIKNSTLSNNTDSWIGGGTPLTSENTTYNSVDCWHVVGELQKYKTLTPYFTVNNTRNLGVQTAGNQYVLSMDVLFENVVKGTTNYYVTLYKSGETIDGTWRNPTVVNNSGHFTYTNGDNLDPSKLNNKGWQRVWIAVEFGDYNWSNANYVFQLYFRDFTGDIYVKNVKVEKGSVATPWTPNPADPEYTKMGFDDGIEYDVSGYGNNGTKTGTITYDVDTPRYWTSSKFSSGDISTDPLQSSVITISFWYKPLSGSSYIVFADTGTGLCFGRENDHINTGISSTARADTISSSGFANNSWYHIVIVKKSDTGRDVYVNGQKVDIVGNNYWTNNIEGLFIGRRKTNNTSLSPYYLNGNIVDFRAYVTALSEADILALYNTPISLTSNGTLLTQGEFTEV